MVDLVEGRCLCLSSVMTVFVLTCKTRAVSRIPLAFIAMATICSFTAGDCPRYLESRRKVRPTQRCSRQRSRCLPCRVRPWPDPVGSVTVGTVILFMLCSYYSGGGALAKHDVTIGKHGASRSHHRRVIGLSLNPGECDILHAWLPYDTTVHFLLLVLRRASRGSQSDCSMIGTIPVLFILQWRIPGG